MAIVGYKFKCKGLSEPMIVQGSSYNQCFKRFHRYWENDYDVDTDKMETVESIHIDFDIDDDWAANYMASWE